MRPKQDFHALKVIQLEIHKKRNLAEIGGNRAAAIIVAVTGAEAICIQTTNNNGVALTATAINDVDTRYISQHICQFVKALLFDLLAAKGRDVQRNILDAFGAAGGGDRNGLGAQFAVAGRFFLGAGTHGKACRKHDKTGLP